MDRQTDKQTDHLDRSMNGGTVDKRMRGPTDGRTYMDKLDREMNGDTSDREWTDRQTDK